MERTGPGVALFDFDETLFHLGTDWPRLRAELEERARDAGLEPDGRGTFDLTLALGASAVTDAAELAGLETGEDLETGQGLYRHFAEERARLAVVTHNGRRVVEEFFRRSGLRPPDAILDRNALRAPKAEAAGVVRKFVGDAVEVVLVGDSDHDRRLAEALGARFLDVTDPLVAYYDRKAGELDELALTYESPVPYKRVFYGRRFDAVMSALDAAPGDLILEIGAGTGYYTRSLVDRGATVTATDISAAYLQQARSLAPEARYRVEHAQELSFDDEQFDKVLMTEVVEHVANPERAIAEAARVLKPGGVLAASTPSRYSPMNLAYGLKRRVRRYRFNEHLQEFTPRSFVRLLEPQFEVESLDFANFLLPYPVDSLYLKLGSPAAEALGRLDRLFARTPVVRCAGWTMVVRARRR